MDNKFSSFVSYALATLSGICFIGGIVILTGEGENLDGENRGSTDDVGIFVKHN